MLSILVLILGKFYDFFCKKSMFLKESQNYLLFGNYLLIGNYQPLLFIVNTVLSEYADMGTLIWTLIVLKEFGLGCPCLYQTT